ncbi:MAG TPA: oligosaccharide flippase family protein [Rhizomicrobium sp.]|nr:oligosaccharide flippase family protein [Rhizomicrobium sp.]
MSEMSDPLNELHSSADPVDLSVIRRGVVTGASFMVLLRLCFRLVGIVSTLVLVRLLSPSDFGLFGLVTGASTILDTLSQLGLQYALLRMPAPTKAHLDTAWTLGILRAALFALMLSASAPVLANFVHDQRLVEIVFALGAIIFLQGFENIALVDYQREFRYDRLFFYQLAGKLSGFVIGLVAAFLLRNYWALVLGTAAQRILVLPLGYIMRPYKPRLDLSEWKLFFHFSKWLMVINTLWVVDQSMIMFVLGRIVGASGIGLYQIANQVGSLPASEIAAPIRDPAAAGFARVCRSPDLLRQSYLETLGLLVVVIMPLSVGIAIMAQPVTQVFLGAKWTAATPLVSYCAFFALFDSIAHTPGALYVILDRQKVLSVVLASTLVIRVPLVVIAAHMGGILAAMAALTASAFLNMFIWHGFAPAVVGLTAGGIFRATWRTVLSSAIMAAAVALMMHVFPVSPYFPVFVRMITIALAGGAVLIGIQYALWFASGRPHAAESMALALAQKILRRFSTGTA